MTAVAVVVPTHNRPALLACTLRSIVAQRDVEFSVTVVDDGSSNPRAVAAVVQTLRDLRVRLIRHDTPRGVSAARNTGISSTDSEWLAFCDDDDVWAPEKLTAQVTLARATSAGWAYAGDVEVDRELRVLNGAPPLPPVQLVEALQRYNSVPAGSSNVIVRRSVLETVGNFDPALPSAEDWDLWIRLGRHGVPACVPRPFVGCRVHGLTKTHHRRQMLADVEIVAARHQVPVDRARHLRWAAWNSMLEGRRFEAFGHYARAVRHGDVASIGRAAVALVHPGIARRRSDTSGRRTAGTAEAVDTWVSEAQTWLDALVARQSRFEQIGCDEEPG